MSYQQGEAAKLTFSAVNGGFPKLGVPFWGPNNKEHSILGSILVSLYFGKLPNLEEARL